ncbi:MAG: ABC transporter permease [Lachnospiraceae bacterium]|nr:ABC transporter permease [Lachnospiraceae bacterium]
MLQLIQCEYKKLKRSKFILIGISGTQIVPFLVIIKTVAAYFSNPKMNISLFSLYDSAIMFLMLLFAPILLTILSTWVIVREYMDGTLKNIFAVPISPTAFLTGKLLFLLIIALLFMFASWLEIILLAFLCSCFILITELTIPSALFFLIKMLWGGLLLYAVQMPFLYLSIRTRGFAAPLIAVAAVSLVNVVVSNSAIAGFYPWSLSYLLTIGRLSGLQCSKGISIGIILLVGLLGMTAGLIRFWKENLL